MLAPNSNNKIKNVHFDSNFTLGQVLYGEPVVNTLSSVIGKYNPSILKENIINSNFNNQNYTNAQQINNTTNTNVQQPNNTNNTKHTNHVNHANNTNNGTYSNHTNHTNHETFANHVNHGRPINFINHGNTDNPTNTDIPTNSDNFTNTDNQNLSKSSDYSTELIVSSDDSSSASSSNPVPEVLSETKFYWEYGNTGLKIKEFKQKMSRNLAIMYYIDKLFNEYIDTVLSNNYSKLFSSNSSVKFNLKTGTIKSNKGKVSAILAHKKITGNFDVLEADFFTISDIKLTDKELKQNSIPNLDSILAHKDNIYHIAKIIKLLNFHNRMTVKSNLSNKSTTLENVALNSDSYVNDLVKKDKKKHILKSNKYSGFYIKIYNDHGKGFIIDDANNIIYYIAANINFKSKSINVRYYAFSITKGKINKL